MTAEIAILNRQAIALAADSAVTIGRKRVWKNGNKLFSLSPSNDIGVMIYGAGDFAGFTWELIVKSFRQSLSGKRFDTVSQCAEEFLQYLKNGPFSDKQSEQINIFAFFVDALEMIRDNVDNSSTANFNASLEKYIKEQTISVPQRYAEIDGAKNFLEFNSKYKKSIDGLVPDVLERKVNQRLIGKIRRFLHLLYGHTVESVYSTGIAFAGFGSNQMMPEIIQYHVDGKCDDYFRIWRGKHRDLNTDRNLNACVIPFAQIDMFQIFMEGIGTDHKKYLHEVITKILRHKSTSLINAYVPKQQDKIVERKLQSGDNQQIVDELFNEFNKYIKKEMVKPVLQVIAGLPKEEMAAMAEALVEITSLRRKVDSPLETVGGPIDVALISKSDGLIWIKRKHYFDRELNQDFAIRKAKRHGGYDAN